MAISAIGPVQDAIAAALVGSATLVALLAREINTDEPGVLNDAAEGQPYPYILVSGATETPDHTFGGADVGIGWEVLARVSIFSQYQGDKPAAEINGHVVDVLNYKALVVAGFSAVSCEYKRGRVLVKAIKKVETRQLVSEFLVRVRQ